MQPFDVLVIDEGSQVKLPEIALSIMAKKRNGRLLIAGDDRQLPPIIGADFPKPSNGDPWLLDSVFGYLRSKDTEKKPYTVQLLENFRLNSTLTAIPAMNFMENVIVQRRKGIAQRSLRLKPSNKARPLIARNSSRIGYSIRNGRWYWSQSRIYNPRSKIRLKLNALPCCQFPSGDDSTWKRREGFIQHSGGRCLVFGRKGCFSSARNHAQIRAIRKALAKRRRWKAKPFVRDGREDAGAGSDCVIASYAVSDIETALFESEFIFQPEQIERPRFTRAKVKCIVCLPRPLLIPHIDLLVQ
jgi:hypothetical protein